MGFADPLVEAGAAGLAALYRANAATPMAVCEAYLRRIDRFDADLAAYVCVDAAGALAAARGSTRRWRDGRPLSALDGCPIAVKANIAVQGLPWHAGIAAYAGRTATLDAACITRLRRSGAVVLGLTNMDEGAFGASTDNRAFGRTRNPWDRARTPGGSSGGSAAAVAAGLCAAALGTDTLGSVRIPAALCGVFGHKPRRGAADMAGIVPLSASLDHLGVLGRSAEDCALVVAVAAGMAERLSVPRREDLKGGRVACLRGADLDGVEPAILAAYAQTLERARRYGLDVQPVDLPNAREASRLAVLVTAAECAAEHRAAIAEGGFSPALLKRMAWADRKSGETARAYAALAAAAEEAAARLAPFEALLTPTTPRAAAAFADPMQDAGTMTALANITAMPATAFPVGLSPQGLPLSVQAMAATDGLALGLAEMLATPLGQPAALT